MAVYMVGDFIKETRLRKGYTQEEVSFGICTPASLSRIENGLQMPGRYMMDKLMERLGYENSLFDTFVSREEMELYENIQEAVRKIADGSSEELRTHIQKLEKLMKNASRLEQQYLIFAKGNLCRKEGGSPQEVVKFFMQAIQITLPGFDGRTPLEEKLLTFDEITIINNLAMEYARRKEYQDALRMGFWLKTYMEEHILDGKQKTVKYPMIVYNLSNWLGRVCEFPKALEVTDAGIDFCINYGVLLFLPKLVFNKACALAEMGEKDSASKFFKQAAVVFETMKQEQRAQTTAAWCKEKYQIVI